MIWSVDSLATILRRTKATPPKITLQRCSSWDPAASIVEPIGESANSLTAHQKLARRGEEIAALYLAQRGYNELKRNWRSRLGELDLVMQHGEEIVIVEVKSRVVEEQSGFARYLTDSVHHKKQRKLVQLTEQFMRHYFGFRWNRPVRIDVVGVAFASDRQSVVEVRHLIAAVSADY